MKKVLTKQRHQIVVKFFIARCRWWQANALSAVTIVHTTSKADQNKS